MIPLRIQQWLTQIYGHSLLDLAMTCRLLLSKENIYTMLMFIHRQI